MDREKAYSDIKQSKDVKMLAREVQKRGEELQCTQGAVSIATRIGCEVIYQIYVQKQAYRFEGLGCLVLALLNISLKIKGWCRRMCMLVLEKQAARYSSRTEGVRRIVVRDAEVISFIAPRESVFKESSAKTLLQTEIILCSILGYNFDFTDLHDILWKEMQRKKAEHNVKKRAWIILSDFLSFPVPPDMIESDLISAIHSVAAKIESHMEQTPPGQADRRELPPATPLEIEILQMYIENLKNSAN